jgi:AcrR family transcriptional regulator
VNASRPAVLAETARATVPRKSFRETQFEARESAILDATNRLLAEKSYETMSMDDIANAVGIAKGSLYRHFPSKEALAAAVMIRLLRSTRGALESLPETLPAAEKLRGLLEWTLRERLAGGVPHLPSTSQSLRDALTANAEYVDELMDLSETIGSLIVQAKREGSISARFQDSFVLYHFYARSCDPTLDFLKAGGTMPDEEIVKQMIDAAFDGISR